MGEVNPMTSNPSDTTNSGQTLGMIVPSHPLRRAGRLPLPYKPHANTSVLQEAAPLQGAAQQPWQRDPYPPKKEQYVGPDRRRKPTGKPLRITDIHPQRRRNDPQFNAQPCAFSQAQPRNVPIQRRPSAR